MTYTTVHDFSAASTDLRLVFSEEGTLAVDPVVLVAYAQLVRGCEPGIDDALLEPRYMEREMLRRCQLAGVAAYDYDGVVLRSLILGPADHLAWRLLLRWRSVTIAGPAGEVLGYAGVVDG